jgi:predicted nucleic acid-binding Zn ribbon protein
MKRRDNQFSIGEAIDAFLESRGLKEQALVERVITDWPRIMGRAIEENTEKVWFRDGIFYVKMGNPIWKNELTLAKSKIKEMLNKEIGAQLIKEVRVF